MKMEEGLDTGDMFARGAFSLDGTENFAKIHDRLAALGAELVVMTMNKIFDGTAHAEKQDEALATYAPKIEKADRTLDFHAPAPVLQNRVRAFSPAPGAEAMLPSGKVKITEAPFPVRGARRRTRYGIRAFRQRRRRSVCQLRAGQASHSEACPGRQKGNVRRRFYPRTPHR